MKTTTNWLKRIVNKVLRLIFPMLPNVLRVQCLRMSGVRMGHGIVITPHTKISCKLGFEHLLTIGDRAAIGSDHIILTSDPSNSKLLNYKAKNKSMEVYGKVVIHNDSWLGAGSIILPNVEIGEFAIIASGAVVTKDVPPYSIAAGVPARVIGTVNT